jgi:hypothetical protein
VVAFHFRSPHLRILSACIKGHERALPLSPLQEGLSVCIAEMEINYSWQRQGLGLAEVCELLLLIQRERDRDMKKKFVVRGTNGR